MENILITLFVILFSLLLYTLLNFILSRKKSPFFCSLHNQLPSSGICHICSKHFCESCLLSDKELSFCNIHYDFFSKNNWIPLVEIESSEFDNTTIVKVHDLKFDLWLNHAIPTIVRSRYIEDKNQIKTIDTLFCLQEHANLITNKMGPLKGPSLKFFD